MLLIDNEKPDKSNEIYVKFEEEKKKIRKEKPEIFSYADARPVAEDADGKHILRRPNVWFAYRANYEGHVIELCPKGVTFRDETWRNNVKERGESVIGVVNWHKNNSADVEKIAFARLFNHKVKKGLLLYVNLPQDAKERIKEDAMELEIAYLIKSEDGGLREKDLRNVAYAWGIPKADDMDVYLLKEALFDKVKNSQANYHVTKRGYAEFKKESKAEDLIRERAMIRRAEDEGAIIWDPKECCYHWKNGQKICNVLFKDMDTRDQVLYKAMERNEKLRERMYMEMHNDVSDDDLDNMKMPQLKSLAFNMIKLQGIDNPGIQTASKEDVLKFIKEHREKVA